MTKTKQLNTSLKDENNSMTMNNETSKSCRVGMRKCGSNTCINALKPSPSITFIGHMSFATNKQSTFNLRLFCMESLGYGDPNKAKSGLSSSSFPLSSSVKFPRWQAMSDVWTPFKCKRSGVVLLFHVRLLIAYLQIANQCDIHQSSGWNWQAWCRFARSSPVAWGLNTPPLFWSESVPLRWMLFFIIIYPT